MPYSRRVRPGSKVDLSDWSPKPSEPIEKEEAVAKTEELGERLSELQELLFAAGENSCLIVLQGMDTSGKDGTIRCLARYLNVQGCRVAAFKQPTPEELSRDFLWRVHAQVPGKGQVTVFNRSHYEDVLVVRVHELVPKHVWKDRFEQINHFEKLLVQSGTIVLKFFLHISKDEQEKRLLAREEDATKAWKLSVGDWRERELWHEYQRAYEEALEKCSTDWAPWHVVPADHKWYRNLAVVEQIVEALEPYREGWLRNLEKVGQKAKKELAEFRARLNGAGEA